MFQIYDDNGSRMLDYEELKNGVKDYGLNMSKNELDDLFKSFDKDNSGSISFDEFLQALRVIHQSQMCRMNIIKPQLYVNVVIWLQCLCVCMLCIQLILT